MRKHTGLVGLVFLLIAAVAAVITADRANAVVNQYTAVLAGTNEVPSQPNGYTGAADITIDTESFQVCVSATTNVPTGTDPIILDHIHSGGPTVNGPIVVDFNNNLNTCVISNATTVNNIVANPGLFYFNVHTASYPGGALRGQLQQVTEPFDGVLIDCDRIAGTAAIKPPLGNTAGVGSVATKGPMVAGTDPFKPATTTRDCTGIFATSGDGGTPDDVGPLTKLAGKLTGSQTCNLLADPPITDPLDPLDGKLTLTYTTLDPLLRPYASATYIRIGGGDNPLLPDELVISNGIVTKGVGVGGDVYGSFMFAPFQAKNGPADQSFIDANSVIVPGAGSATLGANCIAGLPTPPGTTPTTLGTVFFGTDGTGLLGGVLDSSIGVSLPVDE
jgi:hypothetical protein